MFPVFLIRLSSAAFSSEEPKSSDSSSACNSHVCILFQTEAERTKESSKNADVEVAAGADGILF